MERAGAGAGRARAAREDDGGGRRGIETAQRRRTEQAVARRDVALHEIARIGERADDDDGEPDLVGRDRGERGDGLVRHEGQDDADDDEEFRERRQLGAAEGFGEGVEAFARAGEEHGGDGDRDGHPERLRQRDGAEQIGDEAADQRHDAAVEAHARLVLDARLGELDFEAVAVPDGKPEAENEETAKKEERHFRHQRIEQRAASRARSGKGARRPAPSRRRWPKYSSKARPRKKARPSSTARRSGVQQHVRQGIEKGRGAFARQRFWHLFHFARMSRLDEGGLEGNEDAAIRADAVLRLAAIVDAGEDRE